MSAEFAWPTWDALARVLTLRDYNTRVVVLGVSSLGLAAGLVGTFLLLRKRALLGDALSHATLPGIGLAFLVMVALGGTGRSLAGLLFGATVAGVLGVAGVLLIVHLTRIKEDAALGIVLSAFFGLGIALFGLIQNLGTGHAAGLKSFIYGKTASMLWSDAVLTMVTAGVAAAVCLVLFKEFKLLCFDAHYAAAQGWPVVWLDVVMMALVVVVTVIGLQAVGLILMIALLVVPPAAARFWTNHLPTMLAASGLLGAVSGLVGAALSALLPRLPAGAIIVVVAGVFFIVSLLCGPARGLLPRYLDHRRVTAKVARLNLLRAMYELGEVAGPGAPPVNRAALLHHRTWSPRELSRALAAARGAGLLAPAAGTSVALTAAGAAAAWRAARNHRLWELFLIAHADIAPSQVDRVADEVEHAVDANLLAALERQLAEQYPDLAVPPSPHRLVPP
jgi:manganese/zinc/iron transport system permease protein